MYSLIKIDYYEKEKKNYIMKILHLLISLFIFVVFLLVLFLFQTRDVRSCLKDFHLLYCLVFFYENKFLWKTLNYIMKPL